VDWRVKSKCARLTPQESDKLFFSQGRTTNKAKAFCKDCPVIQECLAESLRDYNKGFWAGTPEHERSNMRVVGGEVLTAGTVTFS
jgi:WhiB family transcriptional regulator, redox-sensing transcriptional regulator